MSIINKRFLFLAIVLAQVLLLAIVPAAQDIEATFKVYAALPAVIVEGKFTEEKLSRAERSWTFSNSIAGIENLAGRISEFNLIDEQRRAVAVKKLIDGEYLAPAEANDFSYRVDLKSSSKASAHVSWLADEKGFLMLGDLLPQLSVGKSPTSAVVKFDLPIDWKIASSEKRIGENVFEVENIEKAVFLIGKNWREEKIKIGAATLSLAIAGEWQFSEAEAAKMAGEIYEEYCRIFDEAPTSKAQIFLARLPKAIKFGRWEAETRGATITIISADMAFAAQSRQLLHEQLRHELFHLWMPNNLALQGNYDWFYEGFAIYQALRTGVSMNQIRFEDFLDTLAQAYNFDRFQASKVSLIDASKNRWSGAAAASNSVYARGMLTAFFCDIELLRASQRKRSISTIFQEVYRQHRIPNELAEGNAAVLKILKSYSELDSIIEKYIVGIEKINWETHLESVGIEAKEENFFARLKIKSRLSGKQKDLLNELGYNNWRKISRESK